MITIYPWYIVIKDQSQQLYNISVPSIDNTRDIDQIISQQKKPF